MARQPILFNILLVGVIAAIGAHPARAALSAEGVIPGNYREIYHNRENALVPYKVTNEGDKDIKKIEIFIPSGFTCVGVSTISNTSKDWTYTFGANMVTLDALSPGDAITNGEYVQADINVDTEEGFHPTTQWDGIVTSTAGPTGSITEAIGGDMDVAIIVLSLTGPINDPVLIPGGTVQITCLLLDDAGFPMDTKTLHFSTYSGEGFITTVPPDQPTNVNGEASVDFHVPVSSTIPVGISRIKCMYEIPSGGEKDVYMDVQIKDDAAEVSFERLAFEQDGVIYIKEITPIKLEAMHDNWDVRYNIDSGAWQGWVSSCSFFVSGIGAHTIRFQHRDGSDKEGTVYPRNVYVTSAGPASELINYPNPFQPGGGRKTTFEYSLERDSKITMEIFDLFGQLVWSREISPGLEGAKGGTINQIDWYGENSIGRIVANGGYLGRLTIENGSDKKTLKRKIGVAK